MPRCIVCTLTSDPRSKSKKGSKPMDAVKSAAFLQGLVDQVMLITIFEYITGRLCGFPTLELLLFSYYFLGSLATFARRRLRKSVLEFSVERDRAEEKLTAQKVRDH